MRENLRQFILVFGDACLLYFALILALSVRSQSLVSGASWSEHWPTFSYAFAIWIIVFYIAGLYSLNNVRNNLKFFTMASQTMGTNILLAVAFFYVLPQAQLTPKTILILTGIIFFALFVLWRNAAHRIISQTALKRKALIIGNNSTANELTELLDHNPQYGYEIAAILTHNSRDQIGNLADYRDPAQLAAVLKKYRVSVVVLDNESRSSEKLINNLYQHLANRLEFVSLDRFYEAVAKRISLETINQFWFLENLQEGKKHLYDLGKRFMDIVAAVAFILASFPIVPIIALLTICTSGRPVFFVQTRVGKNGVPFRAIKFRTMVRDAEKNGPQWATANDARVTKLGRLLRMTRLDEIPQLWNILRGEMSFVGPRPERPEFVADLEKEIPFYRERLLVKPGLTGWDQISGEYHSASREDSLKKMQYDLYYIKNRSLVLDLSIILKTIKTVISAVGR